MCEIEKRREAERESWRELLGSREVWRDGGMERWREERREGGRAGGKERYEGGRERYEPELEKLC